MCSEHTTWEDLRLLLLRWNNASALQSKDPQRIFIIANADSLSYSLQRQVSGKIDEFLGRIRTSGEDIKAMAPLLIIAGDSTNQSHLLSHFGDRKIPVDVLTKESVGIVAKNLSEESSRGVRLYVSLSHYSLRTNNDEHKSQVHVKILGFR